MSGLAVFGLKCSSLLDYDRKRSDNVIAQNFRDLYLETSEETLYHEIKADDGYYHQFRFLNGASLNKSNSDVKVNILEYR